MTLCAVFGYKAPVIISDVLLSHLRLPTVSFTPTGIQITPKNVGGYQPSGFSQKVVLLQEGQVAFTGAGNLQTLRFLASNLKDELRKGLHPEALEGWLRRRDEICGRHTGIIVSWCDERSYATGKAGVGVRAFPFGRDEAVLCVGSGTEWLKHNLIDVQAPIENIGEFHEYEMIRSRAIAQTAVHLAQERFMGLKNDFGGGFQTAYFDGRRFVPVDEILYIVLLVEHDLEGPVALRVSSPLVAQRWNGARLVFELWGLEEGLLQHCGERTILRTKSQVRQVVVPPLLYSRTEAPPLVQLSTGKYVSVQTIHHRAGKLIALGSFQMMGDPKLNRLLLRGQPNGPLELSLDQTLYEEWTSRFTPLV